jgi:hypothetical protein
MIREVFIRLPGIPLGSDFILSTVFCQYNVIHDIFMSRLNFIPPTLLKTWCL